ncbi:MAG: hypothetical protein ACR2QC_11325 [Gammaproteobacteria bacterium]
MRKRFALRRMRFRLSPEWRFFIFSDTAKFGIVREDKKHRHSGESRNLFARTRKRFAFGE